MRRSTCPNAPSTVENIIGWYGAIAILTAYALSSFSIIQPRDVLYQLLNFTGAAGIAVVSIRSQTYQPAFLNVVWAVIALIAIVRLLSV